MASLLFFCASVFLIACDRNAAQEALYYSGHIMGTTYNVTVVPEPGRAEPDDLADSIQAWLDEVNQSMSTFLPESELSRLNRAPVGEWLPVSQMMAEVLLSAQAVSELSGGAFDITIAPLVDLWGFGPVETDGTVPDEAVLEKVRQQVGYQHLRLQMDPPVARKERDLQLDLSAIAKGYAADYVGRQLDERGLANHLIEIGGDLLAKGHNPAGEAWRIGVEKPTFERQGVQQAVAVMDQGIATSGGYRNFFQQDGQIYSHILDPRRGRPVPNRAVSVTVIADSAALADAWATAFSVMGNDEGLTLAEQRGLAVYVIVRDDKGLVTRHSEAFREYMDR